MMKKIKHLYWRAGFGLSPQEWESKKNWPIKKAVDRLFQKAEIPKSIVLNASISTPPQKLKDLSKEEIKELRKQERKHVGLQNIDWLKRMADPKEPALLERMTLFWHGHFACQTKGSSIAVTQLNTLRTHALGNFRELVLAIAKDPSMIRFLNNQQNRKQKPNENFARELLELFTIGRGNYTENDIKEAARAFTGWSSNLQGQFVFRERQHDFGKKTFFGKTGSFNGEEIIDLILEKRETADFITRKIYRYFVNDIADETIVQSLSNAFYSSGYDIGQLMRTIFESDWFYLDQHIGTKIKSPVELMAGILRTMNVDFNNDLALIFIQKALGQVLFNPPNVAGWPGGRSWIDNSTLMLRLNLINYLITSSDVNLRVKDEFEAKERGKAQRKLNAKVDLEPLLAMVEGQSKKETFDLLSAYLLQSTPQIDQQNIDQFIPATSDPDYIKWLSVRLMTLPEYQMC